MSRNNSNNPYDTDSAPIDDFNADSVLNGTDRPRRPRRTVRRYNENDGMQTAPKRDYKPVPSPRYDDYIDEDPVYETPVNDNGYDEDYNTDNEIDNGRKVSKPAKPKRTKSPSKRRDEEKAASATAEPRKPSFADSVHTFFCDGRFRMFSGIICLILGVVLFAVTVSHLYSGATDQSVVTNSTVNAIAEAKSSTNIGGAFGSWLSQVLFTDSLGVGAFALVIYLWLLSASLLAIKKFSFWSLTFKCLLVTITLSVVVGLATYFTPGEIYWGGSHGYYVNEYLISHAGYLVAVAVSVALVAAVVCVFINDIVRFWRICRKRIDENKALLSIARSGRKDKELADDEETADNDSEQGEQASDRQDTKPETGEYTAPAMAFDIEGLPEDDDNGFSTTSHTDNEKSDPALQTLDPVASLDDLGSLNIDIDGPAEPGQPEGGEPAFEVVANEIEEADKKQVKHVSVNEGYDPHANLPRFRLPSPDMLSGSNTTNNVDPEEQKANKEKIIRIFNTFGIDIARIEATVGPTVTLYEIVPAEGVRISKIKNLEDEIAMNLSALSIRIIAPIPGKGTIGIEMPNRDPQTVSMRSVLTSKAYQETKAILPIAMGATISNEIFIEDLTKMPHLLVAGGSGTGKSVGLNVIIASLIYKKHPADLKFVLVDPKMVEFSLYEKLERHYLAKLPDEDRAIITDPQKALLTLNSLCVEMDQRYALLSNAMVRTVEDYNKKFCRRQLNPEKGHRYMPYIVIIVDEFADLIMTAGKDVYVSIARLAQKARAVGMHMIIATQRPSTDVITGVIKANFLGRIAFKVSNMVDSKTILDRTGANRLIGRGDMLFSLNGRFERIQCAFMSTEDVESLTDEIDSQIGYEHAYFLPEWTPEGSGVTAGASTDRDPLFDESARYIITQSSASTSSLQRRYSIGYNRASRIMDQMEAAGIVGPASGAKPRSILVDTITLERILGNG